MAYRCTLATFTMAFCQTTHCTIKVQFDCVISAPDRLINSCRSVFVLSKEFLSCPPSSAAVPVISTDCQAVRVKAKSGTQEERFLCCFLWWLNNRRISNLSVPAVNTSALEKQGSTEVNEPIESAANGSWSRCSWWMSLIWKCGIKLPVLREFTRSRPPGPKGLS